METRTVPVSCANCAHCARPWGEKNGHKLFQCPACKLIFVDPIPDPLVYSEEYFSGGKYGFGYVNYDRDKEPMIPTFARYLGLFARHGVRTGRLLDVGAATGFFLDLARKRGYQVAGVDVSDYAARLARAKGIDVRTGTLREQHFPPAAYDIVTMLDVLEHMTDPFLELDEARRILRPGGLLAINSPDGESLMSRVLRSGWHLVVPPEHLFYFSPRNLGRRLEDRGFHIIYSARIGKQFTLAYIFKMLSKWQRLSFWDYFATVFSQGRRASWHIPINLQDNFFLIAKKELVPAALSTAE